MNKESIPKAYQNFSVRFLFAKIQHIVEKYKKERKRIITMARKTAANLNTHHLDLCI